MLALLFDMNSLWEEYVLIRLQQTAVEGVTLYGQASKGFWKNISIRPDIVIEKEVNGVKETFIIDTKWKNIDYSEPSTHDLRQMYVYNDYWNSKKAMLLYPTKNHSINTPDFNSFHQTENKTTSHECALGKLCIFKEGTLLLDETIGSKILGWFEATN